MILVGAPVCGRGWILHHWLDALANQEEVDALDLWLVFNYGPSEDDTFAILEAEALRGRFGNVAVLMDDLDAGHRVDRCWNWNRYVLMTRLRNRLLEYARWVRPDYYLSCDTDMLLPAHSLRTLLADMGSYDAIAPLAFMTPEGTNYPNCFGAGGNRTVPTVVQEEDAIFGAVLMSHRMYGTVDYAVDSMGEDLGWARNARGKGFRLALDPNVRVKHVMNPDMLGQIDGRVGF